MLIQDLTSSPKHVAHLLERLVFLRVGASIDFDLLHELERELATELARLPDVTDDQMLSAARALIARALQEHADDWQISDCDDPELRVRYDNAICREVDRNRDAK